MPATTSTAALRAALEARLANIVSGMDPLWSQFAAHHMTEGRESGREELAESLNQAARRMRQADGVDEIAVTVVDAAAALGAGAAWLAVSGQTARGKRIRGEEVQHASGFGTLEIPLASAPALAGAVESRDPVVAMSTAAELSPGLVEWVGNNAEARVSIFPVVREEKVEALLCCWGEVERAALELLAEVAGLALPAPAPPPPAPREVLVPLVTTPPPPPAAHAGPPAMPPGTPGDWDALPAQEQQQHLRAQRFARVQVAELRLQQGEVVHAGRMHRDLYGALQDSIDAARAKYQRTFIEDCPSMVDYLHLELLRTLANDNPRLLGENYPGPLA